MSVRTRPEILFPVFAPVTSIKGVGPRIGASIERAAGAHIADLFWHLPTGLLDRRYAPELRDAEPGRIATLTVRVDAHRPPPAANRRIPYRINCSDETGDIVLVFFHARGDYLEKTLPVGEQRVVSGAVEIFDGILQMTHPDIIAPVAERDQVMQVHPTYPLSEGLSQNVMRRTVAETLERVPELPEWLDPALVAQRGWPRWHEAIARVHAPADFSDLDPNESARQRLAYDELLASQLAIGLVRANTRKRPGLPTVGDGNLRAKAIAALPFELTGSQKRATDDIIADMASDTRMLRLLQGDVGSGKTVVALLAMLNAIEVGRQAALMAPTEILAQQHFATIAPLAEAIGVSAVLLTGRDKGKARQKILDGLAAGDISIAVGTHALFQQDIAFDDLAVAVVDEQHRFGVHQRLLLADKGAAVDVLLMTATPIPRTLMLAFYGDLDESQLTEKPAGRLPIDTRTIPLARLDEVVSAVGRKLAEGAKVFWVCPLVEESENLDLAAATARHAALTEAFGARVGLVHGQLPARDKDAVMERFIGTAAEGPPVDLLVATTVIEVGVDVPDATVMVIEHAERFGLAQLHQLRGRIGRSAKPSTCLLLYGDEPGETARSRLTILRETDDGFRIAEEDLRLRGAGDLLGTRQSGLPEFRLASLENHSELLAVARDDMKLIIDRDPTLDAERGEALRILLYLFERDAAVRLARAG
ncbi:MAG: ATP-dependent DNA helicase RecG [Alphaproteobacteria bacterium]|nr:ATP-dependent DNA helicase RecG [Alphaproteobacteria bacterium]